jgi:hypothetical protein
MTPDEHPRSLPERYVFLCLRIDRHIEGFVDAYIGPPEWRDLTEAEHPVRPEALREEALALSEALPSEGLEPERERWLSAQLKALECVTASLAGETVAWADEVERTRRSARKRTVASTPHSQETAPFVTATSRGTNETQSHPTRSCRPSRD